MTTLVRSRAEFVGARESLAGPVGLVPTMGALHAGHRANIGQARESCGSVIVTIFVNPLQFAPTEDLAVYPRTLDEDVAICERAGADLVWAPSVADIYPDGGAQVRVDPGPLGAELEGAVRPEHFGGVLTVVAKLLNLTRPAVAFFGEKDYQQLTLITRMAADLELGVAIAGVPTVREDDGLALSSRNVYLSPDERGQALALSRALRAGRDAAADGADAVLAAGAAVLAAAPSVAVDYLALRDTQLGPAPAHGEVRLLVAGRVGRTRLIDNLALTL
ncbi:MAG: pantoate--beta-alanine ligase [Pseudonocardiales bacterium]|nr:MAG: pantoate--beta-alanine ligase [Pseudonocardiales bacterium]